MKIDILTLFPRMFEPVLGESILKRARQKKLLHLSVHNLRDYSGNKHRKVDDKPYGGGPGMVLKPGPLFTAVTALQTNKARPWVVLLTPQGKKLDQRLAKRLVKREHLILICGHYEGIDERVRRALVDEEISIGDYVLTCGEIPAMVLVDCVARLIPGVLGDEGSLDEESFSSALLEYPQYTRPANFQGLKVPKVLISGNHEMVKRWRKNQALLRTKRRRPDLLSR